MKWKIVSVCDLKDVPEAISILEDVGALIQVGKDRNKLLQELADCDAYLGGGEMRVDKEFLDHAPQLKIIGSPATGKDHLDLDRIKKRGIALFHLAEEYDILRTFTATSEGAFALLLALIRKLPAAFEDAKQGIWARDKYIGMQLYGKTLGILGLGRLGTISARIGLGFGMRVIAYDTQHVAMDGVKMVTLSELLTTSDIVSIHIHLTPENEHFMNEGRFAQMKKGAIFINTSRGRIVDEKALIEALASGHLGGAGIDVLDGEWLPQEQLRNHPLIVYARDHDNLLITPHTASSTTETIYGSRVFMAKKIVQYLKGQLHV